jgi:AraC-like DNA-binding protein
MGPKENTFDAAPTDGGFSAGRVHAYRDVETSGDSLGFATPVRTLARSPDARLSGSAETGKRRALERACEYIEMHLGDDISVLDICCHAYMSVSTLERLFHRDLQTTPSKYIRSRRLRRVRQELLHGRNDVNISDLATKYGLCHLGRFSKYFRDQFGISRSELRHRAH